jgi:gluconate 2-dehydrogenase gamma chain
MNDKKIANAGVVENGSANPISRRDLLKGAGLTGAAIMTACSGSVISPSSNAQTPSTRILVSEAFETLTAAESAALDALASRILPSDDGTPGAHEARAVHFIDRGLTGAMAGSREQYAIGLAALDAVAMERGGNPFRSLPASEQDAIIEAMTKNAVPNFPMLNAGFFNTVRNHTIEGTFSDPYYGGNRQFVGWDLIGYPGVRIVSTPEEIRLGRDLAPSRQSAYDMPAYTKDPAGPASVKQGESSHGH